MAAAATFEGKQVKRLAGSSLKLSEELAVTTYKLRRKLNNELYRVPMTLHEWDEEQAVHETDWADLFFDLVYVGMVFNLGNMLLDEVLLAKDGVISFNMGRGLAFYSVLYLVMMDTWLGKLIFKSRYNMSDLYHKLMDLVQSFVVALMAAHVVPVPRLIAETEYNYFFGFITIKAVYDAITWSQDAEVAFWSTEEKARVMSIRLLKDKAKYTVPLLAAMVTAYLHLDWRITLSLLAAHVLLPRLQVMVRVGCSNVVNKGNSVPIHVEYMIHRYGEWCMLMLGEGVLQIIITPVDEDKPFKHFLTVTFSFFILAFLMLIHYGMMPKTADDHAARKSRFMGVLFVQSATFFNMAISMVGVGLKGNLKSFEKIDSKKYDAVVWLLGSSLVGAVFGMVLTKLIHIGPKEIYENTPRLVVKKRIAFWGLRLSLPALYLTMPTLGWKGYGNAGFCLAVTGMLLVINVSDDRSADDYRCAEFDEELLTENVEDLERDIRRLSFRRSMALDGLPADFGEQLAAMASDP